LERRSVRIQSRATARTTARMAAELLRRGQDAPEPAWQELERKFSEYERIIREGASGAVFVLGAEALSQALAQAGIQARPVPDDPAQRVQADVVVIEAHGAQWHDVALDLKQRNVDVVLVTGPEPELADLLEALELRLELVRVADPTKWKVLLDRVRSLLTRRSVERAQAKLAEALAEFRGQLGNPVP
jgi:hypothetical protein